MLNKHSARTCRCLQSCQFTTFPAIIVHERKEIFDNFPTLINLLLFIPKESKNIFKLFSRFKSISSSPVEHMIHWLLAFKIIFKYFPMTAEVPLTLQRAVEQLMCCRTFVSHKNSQRFSKWQFLRELKEDSHRRVSQSLGEICLSWNSSLCS